MRLSDSGTATPTSPRTMMHCGMVTSKRAGPALDPYWLSPSLFINSVI